MRVLELDSALLDLWVARAEGKCYTSNPKEWGNASINDLGRLSISKRTWDSARYFEPSTNWAHCGPIIEREGITLLDPKLCESGLWEAFMGAFPDVTKYSIVGMVAQGAGPTPLVAAMRAYVSSKFGDDVPDVDAPPVAR